MSTKLTVVHRSMDDDETYRRLVGYINSPKPVENSRVFTITPAVATRILTELHPAGSNRQKKPAKIKTYAEDMATGEWGVTGDTIKFSDEGNLIDGQNRLYACVRSGTSFTTHVVFGIDRATFDRMDRGKNRDGQDVLQIDGFTNVNTLAAAVRWAHLISTNTTHLRTTFEPREIRQILKEHYPGLVDWTTQGNIINKRRNYPRGLVTACLYLFHDANPSKARLFSDALIAGNNGGKFAPLAKMDIALAEIAANSSGRVHDVVRAALLVTAWNLYIKGLKSRKIDFKWKPGMDFPEIQR